MTVQEAKEKARKDGYIELRDGVYLETGWQVIEDTPDEERWAAIRDIDEDGFYILTDDGLFDTATDDDIEAILNGESV